MKKTLYIFIILSTFLCNYIKAQDKIYLRDGVTIYCKIASIAENTISYKDTLGNETITTIAKKNVLLAEYKKGAVYIFNAGTVANEIVVEKYETREQRKLKKMDEWKKKEDSLSNNILGFYIPVIIMGRLSVSYERLFANKTMGIKIPFTLTYDPTGFIFNSLNATNTGTNSSGNNTNNSVSHTRGAGFITGIDLNYYTDLKPRLKYYFGPRIRYGTDMISGGLEGLTVQLQNGIFRSSSKRMTSTLGLGVGFFKLSQKYANYPGYTEKQVYPSMSITWRLGFRL